jgi:hypothetical protein
MIVGAEGLLVLFFGRLHHFPGIVERLTGKVTNWEEMCKIKPKLMATIQIFGIFGMSYAAYPILRTNLTFLRFFLCFFLTFFDVW